MPKIVTALAGAALVLPLVLAGSVVAQNSTPRGASPASPAPTGAGTPQQSGTPPAPGTLPTPGTAPAVGTPPQSNSSAPPGPAPQTGAGTPPQTGTGTPAQTGIGAAPQNGTPPQNGTGTPAAESASPSEQQATRPREPHRQSSHAWSYGGYSRWGYVTRWSGPYVIERAHGYQAFVVQGEWVRANTACWGWKAGEKVSFRPSPYGECVLINRTRHQVCPVSCEHSGSPYF
jgi:hypothetical protein